MTKKGEECKAWAVGGTDRCLMHGDPQRVKELSKRAAEESARVRSERLRKREEAVEEAKLTLTQRLQRRAAERQTELVESLLNAAIADGSSRAMAEVWNRMEGKVTDSLSVNAGEPLEAFTTEALQAWLSQPADTT